MSPGPGTITWGEAQAKAPSLRQTSYPDLGKRMLAVLADGQPRCARELSEVLCVPRHAIDSAIRRHCRPVRGGLWAIPITTNQESNP